ncbi:MAG: hypothetical protein HY558_00890 [Euryarchaeota archaeon]|nr:hypothetical protein [Euryarchaeota archaeon]
MDLPLDFLKNLENTPALAEDYNRLLGRLNDAARRLAREVAARENLPPALVSELVAGEEFCRRLIADELPAGVPPAWRDRAPEGKRGLLGFLGFYASVRLGLEATPEYREYQQAKERFQASLEDLQRVLEDLRPPG